MIIDISYTLDGASQTVRWTKIEAGSQALVVPTGLTRSMIICVFCIVETDTFDNKSSFMQLKSSTQMQKNLVFSVAFHALTF